MDQLVLAFGWYLVFLFSTTFHEAAHAWVAQLGGDLTAYEGGQVSLDPRPHIRREPWGMVILPLISVLMFGWPFGFASTPYDPFWSRRYPRRAAWMSLAGPAANLLLVVAAGLILRFGMSLGYLEVPTRISLTRVMTGTSGYWASVAVLLSMLFVLNLILAVFNLLPVPPLRWQRCRVALLTPGSGGIVSKPAPASAGEHRRSPRGLVLVQSDLVAGVESRSAPALSLSLPRASRVDTR